MKILFIYWIVSIFTMSLNGYITYVRKPNDDPEKVKMKYLFEFAKKSNIIWIILGYTLIGFTVILSSPFLFPIWLGRKIKKIFK